MAGVDRFIWEPERPVIVVDDTGVSSVNRGGESITLVGLPRESEGVVVAVKPGNPGGAKGPCRKRASTRCKENRLDESPTTEQGRTTPAPPPETETRRGVKFIPKVSELRRKLGQKAKQDRQRPSRPREGRTYFAHLPVVGPQVVSIRRIAGGCACPCTTAFG